MSVYLTLSVLWLAFGVSAIGSVACSRDLHRRARAVYTAVALISVLFTLLYATRPSISLRGLEYDDAFEYTYAGRVLAQDPQTRSLDLNPLCVVGSIEECNSYASLSHPIGLSTLISWPDRAFGARISYASIVSLFFMWISSIGVFALLRLWDVETVYAVTAAVLFTSLPVSLVLGGTSLAEPTAGALIILSVVLCEALRRQSRRVSESQAPRAWLALALFSVLVLAIFVKRESLSLLLTLPLGYLLAMLGARRSAAARAARAQLGVVGAMCGIALATAWAIGHTSLFNQEAIQPTSNASFSLADLRRWGPDYLTHFFSQHFLLLVPLAIIGLLALKTDRRPLVLLPVIGGYMLLFASFSQSFYAERLGQVPNFHFERYTLEIAPLLAVMAGLGVAWLGRRLGPVMPQRVQRGVLLAAAGMLIGTGLWVGVPYRRQLTREENALRRTPVEAVCPKIPERASVVTSEPILFFLYCDRPVRVVARETIAATAPVIGLQKLRRSGELYIWEDVHDSAIEESRYADPGGILASSRREAIFRYRKSAASFALYRLRPQ